MVQFVNMLKLRGPQEWFHEETKLINALEFQYKDNESPLNYVTMLTPQMIVSHGFSSIYNVAVILFNF